MEVEIIFALDYSIYGINSKLGSRAIELFLRNLYDNGLYYRPVNSKKAASNNIDRVSVNFLKYVYTRRGFSLLDVTKIVRGVAKGAYLCDNNILILKDPYEDVLKDVLKDIMGNHVYITIDDVVSKSTFSKKAFSSIIFSDKFISTDEDDESNFVIGSIATIVLIKVRDERDLKKAQEKITALLGLTNRDGYNTIPIKKLANGVYVGEFPIFEYVYEHFYYEELSNFLRKLSLNPIIIVERELDSSSGSVLASLLRMLISFSRIIFTLEFIEGFTDLFFSYEKIWLWDADRKWSISDMKRVYRVATITYKPDLILRSEKRVIWYRLAGVPPTGFENELELLYALYSKVFSEDFPRETVRWIHSEFVNRFKKLDNLIASFLKEFREIMRDKMTYRQLQYGFLSLLISLLPIFFNTSYLLPPEVRVLILFVFTGIIATSVFLIIDE